MTSLKGDFVSAAVYNSLPHIHEVSNVPESNSNDLEALRALLVEHSVPKNVSVRLIHKHFDVEGGEIMVIKSVAVPLHGNVQVMRPTEAAGASRLRGLHYFVSNDGLLHAYEYAPSAAPDMSKFEPFVAAFCRAVRERGLQHKFGLKLNSDHDLEPSGWTEFEFPEERSTIMIPNGMPTPQREYEISVSTEWHADPKDDDEECSHCFHCSHCSHCSHCFHIDQSDHGADGQRHSHETSIIGANRGGLRFGGQMIEAGTPFHGLVTAVKEVW